MLLYSGSPRVVLFNGHTVCYITYWPLPLSYCILAIPRVMLSVEQYVFYIILYPLLVFYCILAIFRVILGVGQSSCFISILFIIRVRFYSSQFPFYIVYWPFSCYIVYWPMPVLYSILAIPHVVWCTDHTTFCTVYWPFHTVLRNLDLPCCIICRPFSVYLVMIFPALTVHAVFYLWEIRLSMSNLLKINLSSFLFFFFL